MQDAVRRTLTQYRKSCEHIWPEPNQSGQRVVRFALSSLGVFTQLLTESRRATAFGVQTLPTMMLIGADGKVIRHNVRAAELDGELEKMLKRKGK